RRPRSRCSGPLRVRVPDRTIRDRVAAAVLPRRSPPHSGALPGTAHTLTQVSLCDTLISLIDTKVGVIHIPVKTLSGLLRGLQVVEAIAAEQPAGLTELCRALGEDKSAMQHVLATL